MTHEEVGQPSATMVKNDAPLRIPIAKPGLGGHDRGTKVVAHTLREAGLGVTYSGFHQTPAQIIAAAIVEDVDAIGLSMLSGAHLHPSRSVLDLLAEGNAADAPVFGGGISPKDDVAVLRSMGVTGVFTPGAATSDIVEWVHLAVRTGR